MPFDGAGVFTPVNDFTDDQANGIEPQSARFDQNHDDIAAALTALKALVTTGGGSLPLTSVANLSTLDAAINSAIATDGRKNGEVAGAGTGVQVFKIGASWYACDTGVAVQA